MQRNKMSHASGKLFFMCKKVQMYHGELLGTYISYKFSHTRNGS